MKLTSYNTNMRTLRVAADYGIETLHQLIVLLYVARGESLGRTVSEVKEHFNMSQSSSSRACRYLSDTFNASRSGVGLVEHYSSIDDSRIKYFRLNDKGREAIQKMESDR